MPSRGQDAIPQGSAASQKGGGSFITSLFCGSDCCRKSGKCDEIAIQAEAPIAYSKAEKEVEEPTVKMPHTGGRECQAIPHVERKILEDIKSLRDATRAGSGIYFDFASNQAKRGRTWLEHAPEEIRRELCRDCDEDELRTCREATGIDKIEPAPEGSSPTVLIIMGPSGAGKSTALPTAAKMFDIDLSQFAHIDGDDMRGAHRAWKTYIAEDAVNGYLDAYDIYITNNANKSLKKKYSKECLRARKNCVFPWTSIEQAALDLIEEMGYNVYVLGLLISCAESDCRQQNRAETNGRWANTTQKKWEVTMKDLSTMCQATKSHKVLVFESTDVMNMRLVHSRGILGIDDPGDFEGTVEKLKADMLLLDHTTVSTGRDVSSGIVDDEIPKTQAVEDAGSQP